MPPPPRSTLFPYTTLFRSAGAARTAVVAFVRGVTGPLVATAGPPPRGGGFGGSARASRTRARRRKDGRRRPCTWGRIGGRAGCAGGNGVRSEERRVGKE